MQGTVCREESDSHEVAPLKSKTRERKIGGGGTGSPLWGPMGLSKSKRKTLQGNYIGSTNLGCILRMVTGTTSEKKNLENENSAQPWLVLKKYLCYSLFLFGMQSYVKFI